MNLPELSSQGTKQHQFFIGGGEMGKLMRSKEWTSTPLGDTHAWPLGLRNTLGILLNSKFPMFLWWGPDLVCFYNDAYRPSLGENGKHPSILGMKAEEAWAEIWDQIKPMIDQVTSGGGPVWYEDILIPIYRNGKIENVYWTFSYSPVYDEFNTIQGVLVICNETTEKVNARNKLEESRNELEFAIEATELGTFDYSPSTNRFSANGRLREWFGLAPESEIELDNAINAIAETDRERVVAAIRHTLDFSSGGYYDIEYTIIHPHTKKQTIVRAKGRAWFNKEKIAYRFNGTVQDITQQVISRQEIQESETRFRGLVENTPDVISQWDKNLRLLFGNTAFEKRIGNTIEHLLGKTTIEMGVAKDVALRYMENLRWVIDNVQPKEYFTEFQSAKQELFFYHSRLVPEFNPDGTIKSVLGIARDITALKTNEEQFRSLIKEAPVATCLFVGREMKIEIANDKMLRFWGKGDTVMGKRFLDAMPELEGQSFLKILDDVFSSGKMYEAKAEKALLQRNNLLETFYFDFTYKPLRNAQGTVYAIIQMAVDVTEEVITRQSLEESELFSQNVFYNSPVAKMVVTGEGMIVKTINENMQQIIGNDISALGKSLFEIIPTGADKNLAQKLKHIFTTGETYYLPEQKFVSIRSGNSYTGFYNFIYKALYNRAGKIYGIIITATEITEQVLSRQKIQEKEERLNIVIESSELGTWEFDPISNKVDFSEKFLQIITGGNEYLSHEAMLDFLHPDDRELRDQAFKIAFDTGVMNYELRMKWKDASVHWIQVKGKVFFTENHLPLKIIGTVRDVTAEKNYQRRLEEREQKFRTLADSMPQFVWTGDANGNLNYFNQSVYNYSGLTPEQVFKDGWIQIVHPDEREENIRQWLHSIETGGDFIFEHRFRRKDGEYRWQLSRAIPQKDSAGKIHMWVGTSTDIQELKEQDQQKDFFISMASHELKTPVTSIKGYVQILQSAYHSKEDAFLNNSLNVINRQIITLTNLISDLLDLSKIKSGSLFLNKEVFNITDLVAEVVDEIKHINPNYTIEFLKNTEQLVNGDKERIGQVLINFLTNAVKYSPHSKKIMVTSEKDNNTVVISVKDSGIGISSKDQEKIFERFYRVEGKNEKTYPGFGIGLFIASEIIHRHNGKIGVNSEPEHGSVFYFSLPLITVT